MIANPVPGGLDAFKKLEEQEKVHWRQLAIDTIGKECADSGRVEVTLVMFLKSWQSSNVSVSSQLQTPSHLIVPVIPI